MEEIWKNIPRYEGLYQVSNLGRIKSFHYHKEKEILNLTKCKKYLQIKLSKNSITKIYKVHRLVLEAFVGPCPEGMQCRHLDNNPINNNINNIEWSTHKINMQDRIKYKTTNTFIYENGCKLNKTKARLIKNLLNSGKLTQKEIANQFNISQQTVSGIKNKKRWINI